VNILIFGATGPTGRLIVSQALEQGHAVTAFARDPSRLESAHPRLRVVRGDATHDLKRIDEAMEGQDAVVSALGRRKSFRSDRLIERSMRAVVPAMQRAGVRRLILMSSFGVGESRRDAPLLPAILYRTLLRGIFRDKAAAENYIHQADVEWTIVYPVLLTDSPLTGRYRVGEKLALHGVPKISRSDVAHFILGELARPAFVRKTAVISY
jgi:putative NADH-flavin reductase